MQIDANTVRMRRDERKEGRKEGQKSSWENSSEDATTYIPFSAYAIVTCIGYLVALVASARC